jgi:signal transduction histidine kinase
LGAIALRIHQSLDLDTILNCTVTEVRQFLQTDRVLIYRFEPDGSGVMAMESVQDPWKAVLGATIKDPCFSQKYIERYRQGRVQVIKDLYATRLHPCYVELLAEFQVRANLVVPIVSNQQLWGLLIAQHCQAPRHWQQVEVDLLRRLGNQVGVAVQHSELLYQVQRYNLDLEFQVQQRTAELQQRTTELEQSLKFTGLVQRITEKIRDCLDEESILQTVTQELAQVLIINRCKIDLYDHQCAIATTAYEYTTETVRCQGSTKIMAEFPELYQPLLQGHAIQFFERVSVLNPQLAHLTRLACPIRDDQETWGNLWLFRPKNSAFQEVEVHLVEQVANACAIAIRQARLFEQAQNQVRQLAKLDRLKTEFLKTLSHELRTPITGINLAVETLGAVLEKALSSPQDNPGDKNSSVAELLEILRHECQRETKLIDDLLAFTYLDAEAMPMLVDTVDLQTWIPSIVRPFEERIHRQHQQLYLVTLAELPLLKTDLLDLEQILIELLTNACKYTPTGEMIIVSADVSGNTTQLSVSSSGVEIATEEQSRIFDAFYRIPNSDPWQHGGTGLGLALAQKLAQRLGASIQVNSGNGQTTFTVQFPNKEFANNYANCSDLERVVFLPNTHCIGQQA